MAIQNDFRIYPKTKVIRHVSGTTVYSAIAFYSYLMDTFDEPGYLTYETPIKFNTPTSFTMINRWFLDNGDGSDILQYLTGGGIDTSGYDIVTSDDPVYMLDLDATTDFTSADLDAEITDDGVAVGPLLAYKNDYPSDTLARIWVRDTRATPATIANDSAIATTGAGPGAGTAFGASVSGDDIYHNLFTIASFPSASPVVYPQLYVYQDHPQSGARTRIAEWSGFTNFDRSSDGIDILIPVKLGGVAIDGGSIKTFVRQTGDTFTFVESTLTAAGRTPVATETSSDTVNITKGEHYLLYDASDTGSFSAGDIITDTDVGAGDPPTWYAEVTAVTEFTDTTTGVLTLRSLRGVVTDNDNIYVTAYSATIDPPTQATSVLEGVANGIPGDTYTTNSAVGVELTVGLTCTGGTSTAKRVLNGLDAAEGAYVFADDTAITGTARNKYYIDFSASETITDTGTGSITNAAAASTTIISGFNDITVLHVNGTVPTGAFTGTFLRGERVTWVGGGVAWVVDFVTDTSLTLANVDSTDEPANTETITGDVSGAQATPSAGLTDANTENYNFALQSAFDYSVFIQGGDLYEAGRSLSDIYAYLQYYLRDGQAASERIIYTSDGSTITELAAEEYIKADSSYSATKTAPFGTLAGSTFFGAQGVWIEGMATADNNNIKLTNHAGALKEPFTSVNLTISNTRVGDRVAVYLEDGSTTLPNKAQYTSHATSNAQSDTTFDAPDTVTFPNDTPTSGTFIVVDTSASEEHRYRYSSFNNTGGTGDDGQLILPSNAAAVAGSATAGSDGQTLVDSAADFGGSEDVIIGDIIRRTNNEGGWAYVTSVDSTTQLTTTLFYGGITAGWDETATADNYEIGELVVLYTGSDTFFIPYMDFREDTGTEASPGSEIVTVTYVEDREVVIEARNVDPDAVTPMVPFKTTGTITSAGLTQSVIRTEDTVFT